MPTASRSPCATPARCVRGCTAYAPAVHARARCSPPARRWARLDDTATLSTATDGTDAASDVSVPRAGHRRCHRCVGDASGRVSGGGGPSGSGCCRGRCSRGGGCDGRASCGNAIKTLFAETARARAAKAADDVAMSLRLLQDLQGQMDVGIRVNPILARAVLWRVPAASTGQGAGASGRAAPEVDLKPMGRVWRECVWFRTPMRGHVA